MTTKSENIIRRRRGGGAAQLQDGIERNLPALGQSVYQVWKYPRYCEKYSSEPNLTQCDATYPGLMVVCIYIGGKVCRNVIRASFFPPCIKPDNQERIELQEQSL